MTRRPWLRSSLFACALAAALCPGCIIDRGALAAGDTGGSPGLDAWSLDAAGLDAPGLDAHVVEPPDAPGDDDTGPDEVDSDVPASDAGVDAGGPRPTFDRVQRAEAEGSNPTASFSAAPTPGSLLVAIGFHRDNAASAAIAGWDLRLEDQVSGGERRGLVVFSRVAVDGDLASVQVTWDPAREGRLLIQEFRATSFGVELDSPWAYEQGAVQNSASDSVDRIDVTTSDTPAGALLLVSAFGSRDDPGEVSFSALGDALTLRGARSIASAFAGAEGGEPVSTTASWPTARRATAGLLAFSYRY